METPAGSSVHPLVREFVAAGLALMVTVAVGPAANCMLMDAALLSLSLARAASTPVAAASPITAIESRAMIHDRMKTSTGQPNILLASFLMLCAVVDENGAKGELLPAWLPYAGSGGFGMATSG